MEPSITASWSSREKSEGEAAISPSRRSLRPGWRPVVCEGVSGEGWMCEGVSGEGYMCEDTFTQFSHNQLKIHYYTLTPHTLTLSHLRTLPSHASSGSNYTNWKGFPLLLLSVVHFAIWLPSSPHSLQPSWPPQTASASLHAGAV